MLNLSLRPPVEKCSPAATAGKDSAGACGQPIWATSASDEFPQELRQQAEGELLWGVVVAAGAGGGGVG